MTWQCTLTINCTHISVECSLLRFVHAENELLHEVFVVHFVCHLRAPFLQQLIKLGEIVIQNGLSGNLSRYVR